MGETVAECREKIVRTVACKGQIIFGGEMILEVGEVILKECDIGGRNDTGGEDYSGEG